MVKNITMDNLIIIKKRRSEKSKYPNKTQTYLEELQHWYASAQRTLKKK